MSIMTTPATAAVPTRALLSPSDAKATCFYGLTARAELHRAHPGLIRLG